MCRNTNIRNIKKEDLIELYVNQKKPMGEVATILNTSQALIRYYLIKNDIKTRGVSEALKGKYVGEKAFAYKDGKNGGGTEYAIWRAKIYDSEEYTNLRNKVFIRDKFTCPICGKKGGNLQMHHVIEVNRNPDLILEEKNCITMCKKCHSSIRGHEEEYEEQFNDIVQAKYDNISNGVA